MQTKLSISKLFMQTMFAILGILTLFGPVYAKRGESEAMHSVGVSTVITSVVTSTYVALPSTGSVNPSRIGLYLTAISTQAPVTWNIYLTTRVSTSDGNTMPKVSSVTWPAPIQIVTGQSPLYLPLSSEVFVWAAPSTTLRSGVAQIGVQEVLGN